MTSKSMKPKAVRRAWGQWLSGFAWTHALTLTARTPMSRGAINRAFQSGLIRRLTRRVHGSVPYFSVVEETSTGFPHIHALIAGTASLTVRDLEARWPLGFTRTRVIEYDSRQGAAHYFAKSLTNDGGDDYHLSRQLPPELTARQGFATVVQVDPDPSIDRRTMQTEIVQSTEAIDFAAWVQSYVARVIALDAQRVGRAA